MAETPVISVIIPTFNGARFLMEAIESLRQQHYPALDIMVVDDGSTDNTADLARGLGRSIRYFPQSRRGSAAARNVGLTNARGEFLAFLDVDDLWPKGKLALQLPRLLAEPHLDFVLGRIQVLRLPGAADFKLRFEGPSETLTHVHLGSGVFRKRIFSRVGAFDERLSPCEDTDWFIRAREQGVSMTILQEVTLIYRRHQTNTTQDTVRANNLNALILKKSLDRRRAANAGTVAPLSPRWHDFDEAHKRNSDRPSERSPLQETEIDS